MTKLKIGSTEFRADPYTTSSFMLDILNPGLRIRVNAKEETLKMGWNCKKQIPLPGPFPKKFPKVTSSFFVYHVPDGDHSSDDEIKSASDAASRVFIGLTGLGQAEFINELKQKMGSYDPTFDVDAAIAAKKLKSWLKIRVQLKYRHFWLVHPKFPTRIAAILSVPDQIVISAKEIGQCTPEGVIKIRGRRPYLALSETLVRATAEDAHRLRTKERKAKVKELKGKIKVLREQVKDIEKDLDEMKPEGD